MRGSSSCRRTTTLRWYEDAEPTIDEIEEFLTGTRYAVEPERTLATVLFTDIVDSTRTAAELGDQRVARAPRAPPADRAGGARAVRRP